MARCTTRRLSTTFIVVLSLLFSQLALARYVCPEASSASAMAERMATGLPCEGLDPDQPALCAEHSASAPQSFESAKGPMPSAPMLVQVLPRPVEPEAAAALARPWAAAPEARPPPGPLFLSTLRLRV